MTDINRLFLGPFSAGRGGRETVYIDAEEIIAFKSIDNYGHATDLERTEVVLSNGTKYNLHINHEDFLYTFTAAYMKALDAGGVQIDEPKPVKVTKAPNKTEPVAWIDAQHRIWSKFSDNIDPQNVVWLCVAWDDTEGIWFIRKEEDLKNVGDVNPLLIGVEG